MAEEKQTQITNSDDISVLRVLLHTIKGISPVASTELASISVDED